MRVVSLFAGIGGIDLGLERAGHETVAQVEYDEWCTQILTKHWPNVPRWKDIHDVDPDDLPEADVIAGGFPCQPVSLAGARMAQADDRWLWPEFFRIVRHIRPRYVVVENVPGLASAGMGDVLGDLAAIGYDTEWQSVPAAAVGAPHLRWRIFIVAYPNDQRLQRGYLSRGVPGLGESRHEPTRSGPARDGEYVADAESKGLPVGGEGPAGGAGPRGSSAHLANATSAGLEKRGPDTDETPGLERPGRWAVEPDVGRVDHGVPKRVDRLRGLGNAVVPQVAEVIGHYLNALG